METLFRDIRFGIRHLLKSPGFAFIALFSLSLGIGANTAIFSLINTVLLRPFPVHRSDQLVSVNAEAQDGSPAAFSYPDYLDFRDRSDALAGIYASRLAPLSMSVNGNNERLWGTEVSGNYFDVLGVRASKGRTFTLEEDRVKLSSPVVVLTYACWQNRFGGDPNVVDKDIILNGHSFKVIGVMPEGFSGTELIFTPEIFVPITMQEWIEPGNNWLERRGTHNIFVSGRLKDGVSEAQTTAALNLFANQLAEQYPDTNGGTIISLSKPGFILPSIRNAFASFSAILLAIVGLVLLLACTNLASLMLARATKRRKEIAIRLSLGASRSLLIRQLLTESLLLSILGGGIGLLFALWIIDIVMALKPPMDIPLSIDLRIDWRVLLFSIVISLATSVLFGLLPALQATKPDIVSTLKSETTIGGYRRSRLRSSLVVAQISLSLVLLVAAGLMLRSLQHLQTMDVGFQVDNGLLMSFDVSLQGYDETRGKQFHKQILERVRALPGVKSASLTDLFPLSVNYSNNGIYIEGQPVMRPADTPSAMVASIATEYFTAMGTPLIAGRAFTEQDDEKAPKVAVVNETFVRKFLPDAGSPEGALGRRFSYSSTDPKFIQIIGVAKDGKYWNIAEDDQPFVYNALPQSYGTWTTMIVRTESDPRTMIAPLRGEFMKMDEHLPVYGIKTLEEHLGISLFPARVAATLLSGFGLVALTLAAIGIYGVMAYSVAQRTREIGIRMALGARQGDVLRMVLQQGVKMAVIGLGIGLAASFALSQMMSSLLTGVSATDPLTFALVSAVLTTVALIACFVPARRAAKTDPMVALRYE